MQIEKVGVVGCGLMGHGIAQVAAQGGFDVIAFEVGQEPLDKGLARIEKSLAKLASKAVEKGKQTEAEASAWKTAARDRITPSTDESDLAGCDLVIEAIVEDLGVKQELFARLGSAADQETIFASNTSSFPIAEMAQASGRPARFVGMHFFNPVQLMRLVEVVRTDDTDDEGPLGAMLTATIDRWAKQIRAAVSADPMRDVWASERAIETLKSDIAVLRERSEAIAKR